MVVNKNIIGEKIDRKTGIAGWSFGGWLKGNYKTVKEAIKIGVPFLLAQLVNVEPIWTLLVTALGKLALDVLDYYFPKV